MENKKALLYDENGFQLRMPLLNKNRFFPWSIIDTIVYDPYVPMDIARKYRRRYILFLNRPSQVYLDEQATWFNRLAFRLLPQGQQKTAYLTDENPDFDTFLPALKKYMGILPVAVEDGGAFDGVSAATTMDASGKAPVQTRMRPKPSTAYLVLYDRWNRSFDEIYEQHGHM